MDHGQFHSLGLSAGYAKLTNPGKRVVIPGQLHLELMDLHGARKDLPHGLERHPGPQHLSQLPLPVFLPLLWEPSAVPNGSASPAAEPPPEKRSLPGVS